MMTETALMEPTALLSASTQPEEQPVRGSYAPLALPWLIPGCLTGGLLWMCFFPLAQGWLAWIALVPLLGLVRQDASRTKIFLGALVAGYTFYLPALQWMRVADYRMYATWAMLAMYCALYFPAAIWLMRQIDRRTKLPLVVTVPVVWTGLEYVRSFLFSGFAWYFLGHSQHAYLGIVQIADVTGVYGVSFLIAAVNAWLFEFLCLSPQVTRFLACVSRPARLRVLGLQGGCLLGLIVGVWVYGNFRLEQVDFSAGPTLALLQGNLDQRIRNQATAGDGTSTRNAFEHYDLLCKRAAMGHPDLLVWPETSFPYPWYDLPKDLNKAAEWERNWHRDLMETLKDMKRKLGASQLLGLNATNVAEDGSRTQYNSAVLFPEGQRYDKVHRVPFGEYVPLRDWLPFMNRFAPYDFDYSIRAGDNMTRFALGKYRFGVLICFEDTDPFLARQYGAADKDGPAVDFLVNISNDGWFDGTSEHEEHLALCRFRAIETRRAVARAVNMGISAIIDGSGRVLKPERERADERCWFVHDGRLAELPASDWAQYKKVDGVLLAAVPIDRRRSLYVAWGDWLPLGNWALIVVVFGWGWRRRK